jgi:hypothetical protein
MSVVFLIQARARARKAMEILNLITEKLSDMAAYSNDSVSEPWSDSPGA